MSESYEYWTLLMNRGRALQQQRQYRAAIAVVSEALYVAEVALNPQWPEWREARRLLVALYSDAKPKKRKTKTSQKRNVNKRVPDLRPKQEGGLSQ